MTALLGPVLALVLPFPHPVLVVSSSLPLPVRVRHSSGPLGASPESHLTAATSALVCSAELRKPTLCLEHPRRIHVSFAEAFEVLSDQLHRSKNDRVTAKKPSSRRSSHIPPSFPETRSLLQRYRSSHMLASATWSLVSLNSFPSVAEGPKPAQARNCSHALPLASTRPPTSFTKSWRNSPAAQWQLRRPSRR